MQKKFCNLIEELGIHYRESDEAKKAEIRDLILDYYYLKLDMNYVLLQLEEFQKPVVATGCGGA